MTQESQERFRPEAKRQDSDRQHAECNPSRPSRFHQHLFIRGSHEEGSEHAEIVVERNYAHYEGEGDKPVKSVVPSGGFRRGPDGGEEKVKFPKKPGQRRDAGQR